jgi:6-pyruvoyltetrahydropterin/6-carboxytetrahydropterin synthase
MTTSPTILDSDFRYIDKNGILMQSRTELSIAQMLSFLGQEYEYDYQITIDGKTFQIDFKTKNGLIEVIDSDEDLEKYKQIKKLAPLQLVNQCMRHK